MALSYWSCVLFLNLILFKLSIHAALSMFSSSLLTAAQESMVHIHHLLCMHSPEVGDLDCLPLPVPTNGATVNILMHGPFRVQSQGFSWLLLGVEFLGTRHTQTNFSDIVRWLSRMDESLYSWSAVRKGPRFCTSSTTHSIIQCSHFANLIGIEWSHFNLHPSDY